VAEVQFGALTFLAETASAPLAPGVSARIGEGRMASDADPWIVVEEDDADEPVVIDAHPPGEVP
jgi:hypothetical protein